MKFLIVGTNFISDMLCEAIELTEGAEAFAVYSRKRESGEKFAARHNIKRVYSGYSEALSDDEIDAVYVASPIYKHCEQSIAAMRAGKHVLCEKMMAATLDEFYMMKDASKKYGKVLLEAMRPSHDPAMKLIKDSLPLIGEIKCAHLEFSKYSSRYDSFKNGVVLNAFDPSIKNSAISDIGIYPLQYAIELFGMPDDISGESKILSNGFEGEGYVDLYYGDTQVRVVYSKIRDNDAFSYIEGTNGKILIDKTSAPTKIFVEDNAADRRVLDYTPASNNMVHELSAFIEMCRGERSHEQFLRYTEMTEIIVDRVYTDRAIKKHFNT